MKTSLIRHHYIINALFENMSYRKRDKNTSNIMRTLTLVSQIGISMLVPIFLCFFIGLFLDKKLGSNFCIIIFFFIGAIAGFRNVYVLVMRTMKINDNNKAKTRNRDINNIDK